MTTTVFTQAYLDRLDEMIASGVLTTKYQDKQVTYRSMDELLKARAFVAKKLGQSSSATSQRIVATFDKGLTKC